MQQIFSSDRPAALQNNKIQKEYKALAFVYQLRKILLALKKNKFKNAIAAAILFRKSRGWSISFAKRGNSSLDRL